MTQPTLMDPLATGRGTLEGVLGLAGLVFGLLLTLLLGVGPLFTSLSEHYPNVVWLQVSAVLSGTLLAAYNTGQLTRSRTYVKAGALEILKESSTAVAPLLVAALAKKYGPGLAGATNSTPAPTRTPTPSSMAKTPVEGIPLVRK